MKPNQNRLQLNKHAVANLTNPEMNSIKGGAEEAWTTSKRQCTGFLCCDPYTYSVLACPTNTCTCIVCLTTLTI